jgi:hypothetical protein
MENFSNVTEQQFIKAIKFCQENYKHIRQATTAWNELHCEDGTSYYLSGNPAFMGFALSSTGELTSVFSAIKGKGDTILSNAIRRGACHLDCFDGYLPTFYARHGFQEVRREPNWTPGEPDVVFMERF